MLYIRRLVIERVWVPMGMLAASARATAKQMLNFLEKLKAHRYSQLAVDQAATIIVTQFKHDLLEMNIVRHLNHFKATAQDGCVFDTCTAGDYAAKVFVPEYLPSEMSTKSFLTIAMDLLNRTALRDCIAKRLYKDALMVPRLKKLKEQVRNRENRRTSMPYNIGQSCHPP